MSIKHLKSIRFTFLNTLFVLTMLLSVIGCRKNEEVPKVQEQLPFLDLFKANKTRVKMHSHNDYEHPVPLFDACRNQVFSMEADIWNSGVDSALVLGHWSFDTSLIFKDVYIRPIVDLFEKYNGQVSSDPGYTFILMLDIKTEAYSTLRQVVRELTPFRKYFDRKMNPRAIKIVISGGRPLVTDFEQFPDYIYFDGSVDEVYNDRELERIGFISADQYNYFFSFPPDNAKDSATMAKLVNDANAKGKIFRLYSTWDRTLVWKYLYSLPKNNMILINTDHVSQCATFFGRELK